MQIDVIAVFFNIFYFTEHIFFQFNEVNYSFDQEASNGTLKKAKH